MTQHWHGIRSGWNTRGGTPAEQLQEAQLLIRDRREHADQLLMQIHDILGDQRYLAWVENLPNDVAQIIIEAEKELAFLAMQVEPENDECIDNGVNHCTCSRCRRPMPYTEYEL